MARRGLHAGLSAACGFVTVVAIWALVPFPAPSFADVDCTQFSYVQANPAVVWNNATTSPAQGSFGDSGWGQLAQVDNTGNATLNCYLDYIDDGSGNNQKNGKNKQPNVPTSNTGSATASATWAWQWNGPIDCPAPGCTFDWTLSGSGYVETSGNVYYTNANVVGGSGKASATGNASGSAAIGGMNGAININATFQNVGGSASLNQQGTLNGNTQLTSVPGSPGVTINSGSGVGVGAFSNNATWKIQIGSATAGQGFVAKGTSSFSVTASATISGTVNCNAMGALNTNTVVAAVGNVDGEGSLSFSIGNIYLPQ